MIYLWKKRKKENFLGRNAKTASVVVPFPLVIVNFVILLHSIYWIIVPILLSLIFNVTCSQDEIKTAIHDTKSELDHQTRAHLHLSTGTSLSVFAEPEASEASGGRSTISYVCAK